MQARFSVPSSHPFNLLAAVGRDCIGAIQLYPEHEAMPDVQQLASAPLSEAQVAAMLRGYQHAPLGMEADTDFRISLAGAQEKTALLWHNQQWQLTHWQHTDQPYPEIAHWFSGATQYRPAPEQS